MSYLIVRGVPLVVQLEGLTERLDREADTETRLSWEQQLDHGDAVLTPLEGNAHGFTHRLVSKHGGWFHVEIEEGERDWPEVALPASLSLLAEMCTDLEGMRRQIETLLLANTLLEDQVRRFKRKD